MAGGGILMYRKAQLAAFLAIVLTLLALWPATTEAQYRWGPRPHRVAVGVGGYWGYPSFGLSFGYPWYPYPYWGYPGYPYPYYGVRYQETSSVRLQVTPRKAEVFADGYYVGLVDDFDGVFQRLDLPPGEHQILLYLEGYRSVRQRVTLRPRSEYKIRYDLVKLGPGEKTEPRPLPPPEVASPEPRGPGRVPPGQPVPRRPVPPNRPIPPDQPGPPDRPAPPPVPLPPTVAPVNAAGFGSLILRVRPAGAEVFIDGERWRGPEGEEGLVVQVAVGTHRIEIGKPGYQPFVTDVEIRDHQRTPLNVSLPPRDGQS
jgi:hypothetical protein